MQIAKLCLEIVVQCHQWKRAGSLKRTIQLKVEYLNFAEAECDISPSSTTVEKILYSLFEPLDLISLENPLLFN